MKYNIKTFESYNDNDYKRVIPRDFFNEAKLLKCMGFLALKILDMQTPDGIDIHIEESGEPFRIGLIQDGSLTVENYTITVNGEMVIMKSTYNSKSNFPLFCEIGYDEVPVFDENGNFDEEFIEFFNQ